MKVRHMSRRWVSPLALALATSVASLAAAGCGSSDDASGKAGGGTSVKIAQFPGYPPSEIEANVLATIAAEHPELGVSKTSFVSTDVPAAWAGLGRGDSDVLVEADMPNQQPLFDKTKAETTLLSELYADAGMGFFVPKYVVDGPDAPAAGLKSIDQLNEYRDVFGGKFYDDSPGWASTEYNAKRLKAYGLDFTHVKLSDAALVAQVSRAYERKEPVVFFFYHPHSLFQRYDLVELQEPNPYKEGCFTTGEDTCALPSFDAWVAARKDLEERAPKFYAFLKEIKISAPEIEGLMQKIDVDKQPVAKVAQGWVEANAEKIDQWVATATGGSGS
jgi:glycine betaine/proline transport system substrate-binding protein